MTSNSPDLIAEISFNDSAKDGDAPITDMYVGIRISFQGKNFEAVIDLRKSASILRNRRYELPVFLIDPEFSLPSLWPKAHFKILRGREIGEGVVISKRF